MICVVTDEAGGSGRKASEIKMRRFSRQSNANLGITLRKEDVSKALQLYIWELTVRWTHLVIITCKPTVKRRTQKEWREQLMSPKKIKQNKWFVIVSIKIVI